MWSYIDESWLVVNTVRHDELVANEKAEQAALVRQSRNNKLNDSDWTQLVDSKADTLVWATYRQSLRDITNQSDFPFNVNFPAQP